MKRKVFWGLGTGLLAAGVWQTWANHEGLFNRHGSVLDRAISTAIFVVIWLWGYLPMTSDVFRKYKIVTISDSPIRKPVVSYCRGIDDLFDYLQRNTFGEYSRMQVRFVFSNNKLALFEKRTKYGVYRTGKESARAKTL